MRKRFTAALTAAALLSFAGVAAASHVESSPGPTTYSYHGSDGAGAISFTILFFPGSPYGVNDVRFANRCVPGGSTGPYRIDVSSRDSFSYSAGGLTITGSLNKSENWKATGTVRVVTASGCDSGTLDYTATRKIQD